MVKKKKKGINFTAENLGPNWFWAMGLWATHLTSLNLGFPNLQDISDTRYGNIVRSQWNKVCNGLSTMLACRGCPIDKSYTFTILIITINMRLD